MRQFGSPAAATPRAVDSAQIMQLPQVSSCEAVGKRTPAMMNASLLADMQTGCAGNRIELFAPSTPR